MEKNKFCVFIIIIIILILTNIFDLIIIMNLMQKNVRQNIEIKDLEYQLEYVCEKL